jgi:arsenate reductase
MATSPFNVLFLCNGNSARSIMAEAILNKLGAGKFQAYSAGSQPEGHVHPETIRLLQSLGYETTRFRSKSWNEFGRLHWILCSPSAMRALARPVPYGAAAR